jgi:DNA-binding LacI/PurR family transcriptional regulator
MIVHGNRVSLHLQVGSQIEQRIRRGEYTGGQTLPSFRALSKEFGVSLNVIQRAVTHLSEKGVLVPQHGRGLAVAHEDRCKRSAILFGFVQPYTAEMAFEQQVLLYGEQAFANRDNLMVVRSSQSDPAAERDAVRHLMSNGVQGILLWPVHDNPNGAFFQNLSEQIPIVLVDRLLEGANLPGVVMDFGATGGTICRHLLETVRARNILILIDTQKISPNRELVYGFGDAARELRRSDNVNVLELPIVEHILRFNVGDFSTLDDCARELADHLSAADYDALFCLHEEYLDYVLVETGLLEAFPKLQLASMTAPVVNTRSRQYVQSGVVRWVMDFPRMISTAADILQEWVLTRTCERNIVRISTPPKRA